VPGEAKAAEETRVEAGAYERLGLTRLAKTGAGADKEKEKTKGKAKGSKRKAGEMEGGEGEGEGAGAAVEAPAQSGLLYQFSQHLARAVNNARGKLDFGAIFGAGEAGAKRPLKLEICTGAGEWIVAQAAADRASDWVALELRFDRAYQTFARGHFQRLRNLCVLRGDANVVLGSVEAASLGQIYINHPEPPQQRGASLESTGKHLLTREFFVQCEGLLERAPGACITVLTDNLWYGRFLINMLNANAASVPLTSFHSAASVAAGSVCEAANDFLLYSEAPLGLQGAAVVEASSYFDRLWKRESVTERYYIVLQRWDLSKRRPQYVDLPVAGSAGKGGKDGKGKSCDKSSKGNTVVKVKAASYASGNEMSQSNSKYSVKCSGVIVAPQGKKQTFDDDDE
jgi:tRNA G46 methylase TrmB